MRPTSGSLPPCGGELGWGVGHARRGPYHRPGNAFHPPPRPSPTRREEDGGRPSPCGGGSKRATARPARGRDVRGPDRRVGELYRRGRFLNPARWRQINDVYPPAAPPPPRPLWGGPPP